MAGELFEREAERAALASAVERVATGDGGGLLMVLGEAGIGKTALLAVVAERLAGAFAGLGVRRGDRVALWSRNQPELAIAAVAAAHLGAAVVAPHVAAPAEAIAYLLRDSDPRVLAVEAWLEHSLQAVEHTVSRVVALDNAEGRLPALSEVDAPAGFSFEARWRSVQAEDPVAILYTSGARRRDRACSRAAGRRSPAGAELGTGTSARRAPRQTRG